MSHAGSPYGTPRDSNRVPLLAAASTADGYTPVTLEADPITHLLQVSLGTLIAGEDQTNNRLMVSSETALLSTNVFNAVSFTTSQEKQSASIDCSNYRSYFMVANGSVGNLKILLQVSFDGGSTWFWHPNGQSTDNQYPAQQGTIAGAPLCRVDIVNDAGSTQTISAYLGLAR